MRYFITGATGFIGSKIVAQLILGGHDIIALVRDSEKGAALREHGVVTAMGDITEKDSMHDPMSETDGVFHVAAWYEIGVKTRGQMEKINVQGTRNVLELMRELDIPKGVYTSSLAVYSDTHGELVDESYLFPGTHISVYDRTKWMAQYEVARPMMEDGLPLVIVLPGAVYGPGDTSSVGDSFRQYLRQKLPLLPKQTTLCWSHVDDVAMGHVLAMEKGTPGEDYILAGEPHTLESVFDLAEKLTGFKAPKRRLKPGMVKAASKIMGALGKIIPLPKTYSGESLRVVAGTTYLASNKKAVQELGYSVRPLEEGLKETLESMMLEMGIERIS